jgi:hypothetical protein
MYVYSCAYSTALTINKVASVDVYVQLCMEYSPYYKYIQSDSVYVWTELCLQRSPC